jgi:hypothetical protein
LAFAWWESTIEEAYSALIEYNGCVDRTVEEYTDGTSHMHNRKAVYKLSHRYNSIAYDKSLASKLLGD